MGISGTKFYKEGRLSQPVPRFSYSGREMTELPLTSIKVHGCVTLFGLRKMKWVKRIGPIILSPNYLDPIRT